MSDLLKHSELSERQILVAFVEIAGYAASSDVVDDMTIATSTDEYYQLVTEKISAAGGVVVKFMGDGALLLFEGEATDMGIRTLIELKKATDKWLRGTSIGHQLLVKAHLGSAVVGQFGVDPSKRFDVIGRAVNITARLRTTPFGMTQAVYQELSEETISLLEELNGVEVFERLPRLAKPHAP